MILCMMINLLVKKIVSKIKNNAFYVQIGTIWMYENKEYVPVDELHPKNAVQNYGKQKGLIEEYLFEKVKSGELRAFASILTVFTQSSHLRPSTSAARALNQHSVAIRWLMTLHRCALSLLRAKSLLKRTISTLARLLHCLRVVAPRRLGKICQIWWLLPSNFLSTSLS